MSHFYGSIQGSRGIATRGGTKKSGMIAHIRGWNIGVRIELNHANGRDVIQISRTHGSYNADVDPKTPAVMYFDENSP